jgi:phosphoglycerate dehydrogenase-like enzyme
VEVLVTGWGCPRIDADVLARAPRLRAVVHAAGSVKGHVDPAVFDRGVIVSSAAPANAVPVAEYTVAVVVLAAKRALTRANWYARDRAAGDWRSGAGTGLYGRTVGVIGASTIGRLVLERLRGFDVRPLLADPYVSVDEAQALGAELVAVDELCRRADVVSVHAPALPETHHLLDARRLALLPDGATVVNTARGSLVDTAALTDHCAKGRIDAVLDVTEPEPLPVDHPLLRLPNVLVTPHLAGSQGNELRRLGDFVVAEVGRLVRGEPLRGAIQADQLHRLA